MNVKRDEQSDMIRELLANRVVEYLIKIDASIGGYYDGKDLGVLYVYWKNGWNYKWIELEDFPQEIHKLPRELKKETNNET